MRGVLRVPQQKTCKKAVKDAWKKRSEGCQMRHTRLQKRAIKFSEAAEWIKARYEGASSSVRRDLAIGRLKVFCLSFAVALESCTEQTKKAYAATFERYKSACARAAIDPSSAGGGGKRPEVGAPSGLAHGDHQRHSSLLRLPLWIVPLVRFEPHVDRRCKAGTFQVPPLLP